MVSHRRWFTFRNIHVDGKKNKMEEVLKYLGVESEKRLSHGPHIEEINEKCADTWPSIGRLFKIETTKTGKYCNTDLHR